MATLDGTWNDTYDAAGQLIRAIFTSTNPNISNQDLAYNYDPLGNRISTVINGVTTGLHRQCDERVYKHRRSDTAIRRQRQSRLRWNDDVYL